jgi:tol-pal system protein YbgF
MDKKRISMKKRLLSFTGSFSVLCYAVVLAGCVSSQDMGSLQYDLIILRSEINELKKDAQIGGKLDDRLKVFEEEQRAAKDSVSDLFMKVQSLTGEFQVLTGRFDETQYSFEKKSKDMTDDREALIAQLKELEFVVHEMQKKLASSAPAKTPDKKQQADETKESEDGTTPKPEGEKAAEKKVQEVYMEAYGTFRESRFPEARKIFESLLKEYPENEYSDNARFWIGESYFKEKNYEDAILAYEELMKENPESEKVSGALLKQGLAFYKLKDEETGKIILEKLVEQFPDSEQAKIAKKKIRPPVPEKKVQ